MKRAPKDQDLLKILKEMESFTAQYPEELLAARRASFLEQVEQSTVTSTEEQPVVQDQKVLNHLRRLGSIPAQYPPQLLAARKALFVRRIIWLNFVNLCAAAWMAITKWIPVPVLHSRRPASLLAAGLALAAFVGYLFFENQAALSPVPAAQLGTVQSGRILTSDTREVRIICKPGAQPPLCLAGEYKHEDGLTYQGNGSARPAVAKDTAPGLGEIHKAAYVNDGLYGPGASWISNSRNSWIKIDLGKATKINTVTFGRDRLGKLSGHDPGQFVVSLALTENLYANGNNSNDIREYQPVFDSEVAGFSGTISDAETVTAQFAPQLARYIKITFENKGTVIDEVEAFMALPPVASSGPGTTSQDKPPADASDSQETLTASSSFTATSMPADTATPLSTVTLLPSDTATPIPSATVIPTNTEIPTSTAIPTSTPVPTDTPTPVPSDTPLPPPTNTPDPPETDTPEPTLESDLLPRVKPYEYLTHIPDRP